MRLQLTRLAALAFAVSAAAAYGQGYPNKSIKMIVPFPPAGSTDLSARAVAGKLQERLGQAVVIENKPGAGGNIGGEQAAKSPADGYTLFVGTVGTNAINASLYSKMPYDHARRNDEVGEGREGFRREGGLNLGPRLRGGDN